MKQNPAQRRYMWRFLPTMASYVVLLFGSNFLVDKWHPGGILLVALAVLPALPLIATIVVLGLYLAEERDEYLRRQMVIAMLFGLAALLSVATVWGFLQVAELVGSPPTFLAFPFWCVGWALAQGVLGYANRGRDTA